MKKLNTFISIALLVLQSQSTFATSSLPELSDKISNFLAKEAELLRDRAVETVTKDDHYSLYESTSLRDALPEHTLAYMRIPNIWGMLAAPKETVLKQVFVDENLQQQLQQIESAIYHHWLQKIEPVTRLPFSLLLHHVRSPAEFAFFLPEADAPPMMANALFTVKLDFSQIADVNTVLQEIVAQIPELELAKPLSNEGFGMLATAAFPLFLHYEVESHLLTVLSGMTASDELLKQALEQAETDSAMYAMEEQIDDGQQGFLVWVNMQQFMPLLQNEIPPSDKQLLEKLGLLEINSIGFGWGSADGKGRLKLIVDAPKAGYRQLMPDIENELSLTTAGTPKMVALLSLPALQLLEGVEKILSTELLAEEVANYQQFKLEFQQEMGFSVEELFQFFGQEIVFFSDEVGDFFAIQIDPEQDLTPLINLVEKQGGKYEVRTIDGLEYYHLRIHIDMLQQDEPSDEIEGMIMTLLNDSDIHLYWTEESGYLIFASLPQLLFERDATLQRVGIWQWLEQEQRQWAENAFMLFSMSIPDSPRYFYHMYLNIINFLADIAHAEIDLFALPSARQLNLPESGSYGAQIDISGSNIALELIFDNNPLDFLLNSSSSVVVLGVMAAIAIPAYVDFQNKTKVTAIFNSLSSIKTPVLEYVASTGKFPTPDELGMPISSQYIESVTFTAPSTYTAIFNHTAGEQLAGKIMSLSFDMEEQVWHCVTTIAQNYINTENCQTIEE